MTNSPPTSSTVILVTQDGMGHADTTLQRNLLRTYLTLLRENRSLPAAICFYTNGVKTVAEGSPVLEELQALEAEGVRLIICSTCLNYFNLTDGVRVGIVGGMADILEAQWRADRVITL